MLEEGIKITTATLEHKPASVELCQLSELSEYSLFKDTKDDEDYSWFSVENKNNSKTASIQTNSSAFHAKENDVYKANDENEQDTNLAPESPLLTKDELKIISYVKDCNIPETYHKVQSDGTLYIGQAIKHGQGILIDKEKGITYKGEFKYDMRNGNGTQIFKDGSSYEGGWKDDKFHGFGSISFANGLKYEGYFINGVSSGNGLTIRGSDTQLLVSRDNDETASNAVLK